MNHKALIVMTSAFLASLTTSAGQDLRKFDLENSVPGGKEFGNLYPYSLSSWACRETDDIIFYKADNTLAASAPDGTESAIGSFDDIRKALGGSRAYILEAATPTDIWVTDGQDIIRLDCRAWKRTATIEGPYDDVAISPDLRRVAFTRGGDLYVSDGKKTQRVNKTSEAGVKYGSTVHRNEFGINGGMFWSPDGERLCFYRKDESMVANYPLVDVTAREGKVVNTRYPMAGEVSEQVSVGIYDMATGKTTYLKTAQPVDRYFTNISWSPDGSLIGMAEINRDQDHMWYNIYDSRTGRLSKTLFEESDSHWVEPCEPALWTDANHFVWASYRDGFRHLYLYDARTGNARQLTSGQWCVTATYGFDPKTQKIIAQTNSEGYMYRNVAAIGLDGSFSPLSPEKRTGAASYANGKNRMVINSSCPAVAKESRFRSTDGNEDRLAAKVENPFSGFAMPEIRLVDLKSADGAHSLTGRMVLPTGFDPAKKYPTIVYVYGGPHSQLVDGSWLYGAGAWMLYYAQEGYIVFTMDNRGTEMRGSAFEQCVHRQLGKLEMEDQMAGVDYLRSLPYVDQSRIGVHGWSFGGFMTISLLTTYPDVFRAGVAGGPVCDWKYYEVMYGERYMDTPQQNPDGYEANSLLGKIGNLKARLLVIHGAMDSTVVWQNSQMLLNSAIEKGIYIDYSVYPNHPHNVSGHDRTHLMGYIKRYFDDFLKPVTE